MLPSTLVTHGLLMFPPCGGMEIPCAANQDRNCGRVNKITDQSAHLWKRPPA